MRCHFQALIASLVLQAAASGSGQWPQPRLTFNVAAIHPSKPEGPGGGIKPLPTGTGYIVEHFTVKGMMSVICRIPARQITGGPEWFGLG